MQRKGQHKRRGFSWFTLILCVVIGYFSILLIFQQTYLGQVRDDRMAAETRLAAAREEHERLVKEKEDLQSLDYIEKIAREDLGMTRSGEMPYSIGHRHP